MTTYIDYDAIQKRFEQKIKLRAARRAISIVNKLPPGEFRARHTSRVFSNFNRLRVAA